MRILALLIASAVVVAVTALLHLTAAAAALLGVTLGALAFAITER